MKISTDKTEVARYQIILSERFDAQVLRHTTIHFHTQHITSHIFFSSQMTCSLEVDSDQNKFGHCFGKGNTMIFYIMIDQRPQFFIVMDHDFKIMLMKQ